jgi:hypothetical protein
MPASPGRKGAAVAESLKNPTKAIPDRETSCHQRHVPFTWARLDKPHLCPRRHQRLSCQCEPQLHHPGRDRLSLRDRWPAKVLHLPEHQSLSRNDESGLLSVASITAGGRAEIPWAGRKGGGSESDIPENVIPLTGRPVARTIYSEQTVAVHAGATFVNRVRAASEMLRTCRGTAAKGLSHQVPDRQKRRRIPSSHSSVFGMNGQSAVAYVSSIRWRNRMSSMKRRVS